MFRPSFCNVYMGLGDKDQAFEWFNKTVEENSLQDCLAQVDPRFDSLRSDPRFERSAAAAMKLVS